MSWRIIWAPSAVKELERQDSTTRERIRKSMKRFTETGQGDIRRHEAHEPELAMRIGDWRIFFIFDEKEHAIKVLRIRQRGQAYRS